MTTIFDSDKVDEHTHNSKNDNLKEFLVNNGFDYHEWLKREIENYIPLSVYKSTGFCNTHVTEPDQTPSVWSYTDIENHPYFKGKYKKKHLPKIAKGIDKKSVKEAFAEKPYTNRVDNHPISELQHLIFLLAKYI